MSSKEYLRAAEAQAYYRRDNKAIIDRMTFMQQYGIRDSKVKFFKLRNGFFAKAVKQESLYLLSNGVTLDEATKAKLGPKFDQDLRTIGMQALVDGVNWGYWQFGSKTVDNVTGQTVTESGGRLRIFRATEFCPIFDDFTGNMRLGIRFWQIDEKKPVFYAIYDESGVTIYEADTTGKNLVMRGKTRPYKATIREDAAGVEVTDIENSPAIPVFPLYANELKTSELTDGLKEDIDAYDFINSDLADGITKVEGVYWILKKYGGNNAAQLIDEIQKLKMIMEPSGEDDVDATGQAIEVPFQAKQMALDLLTERMYSEYMALDIKALSGSSLTATAIKVAMQDFDLKADLFEYQAVDFVQNILSLLGIETDEPKFKRRSLTNDSETIQNIYIAQADIPHRKRLELNPMVPDEELEDYLDLWAEEQLGVEDEPEDTEPVEGEGDAPPTEQQVEREAEQAAGKQLNGAQTQSLIAIIGQYSTGAISLGQAINIVSVAIGISKDEAKNIIEGIS